MQVHLHVASEAIQRGGGRMATSSTKREEKLRDMVLLSYIKPSTARRCCGASQFNSLFPDEGRYRHIQRQVGTSSQASLSYGKSEALGTVPGKYRKLPLRRKSVPQQRTQCHHKPACGTTAGRKTQGMTEQEDAKSSPPLRARQHWWGPW